MNEIMEQMKSGEQSLIEMLVVVMEVFGEIKLKSVEAISADKSQWANRINQINELANAGVIAMDEAIKCLQK